MGHELFHPTTLVNFRQRLIEHDLNAIGFGTVLDALVAARNSRQRLDSTQMFGSLSRMSRLDCVQESLRLTLKELEPKLGSQARPQWWTRLWDRYVDSQTDYRASMKTQKGSDKSIVHLFGEL